MGLVVHRPGWTNGGRAFLTVEQQNSLGMHACARRMWGTLRDAVCAT